MNARELTQALGGRWRGHYGMALCPAHKERTASLSIWTGDKQPRMVKCHGGCSAIEVIHALKQLGLWPDSRKSDEPFVPREKAHEDRPTMDFEAVAVGWAEKVGDARLSELAESLHLTLDSLRSLGVGWASAHRSWSFPMRDGSGKVCGIRLRGLDGKKFAVIGSVGGLFFSNIAEGGVLWIVEGPTDCAAGISIGLNVLGRASCNSCVDFTLAAIERVKPRRVVILADDDDPGIKGAAELQKQIGQPSAIWIPPAKDLREYVRLGGGRADIEAMLGSLTWTRRGKR